MQKIPDPRTACKPLGSEGTRTAEPPRSARKRLIAALVLLAMVVAGVSLAMRNPVQVLGGGGCPTRRLAGVYCPGCGTLRATHHLLNGRIVDAWRHNPAMLVAGIPCVLWLAVSNTLAVISGPTRRNPAALGVPTWLLWFAGAALLGWGVVRNLPAPALDWTRPPDPASPAP